MKKKKKEIAEIRFKLITVYFVKPPWRNGLACWTSNSKVVGSSPTGGGVFLSTNFLNQLSFLSPKLKHVKC